MSTPNVSSRPGMGTSVAAMARRSAGGSSPWAGRPCGAGPSSAGSAARSPACVARRVRVAQPRLDGAQRVRARLGGREIGARWRGSRCAGHASQVRAQRGRRRPPSSRGRPSAPICVRTRGGRAAPPARPRQRARPRRSASRTRAVFSFDSVTLGSSNGSTPRTAPATAVANSQRKNSAPTQDAVVEADVDDRVPGRGQRVERGVHVAVPLRVGTGPEAHEDPVGAVRPRARPAARRRPARCPMPCLPVDSAMSCSSQAPRGARSGSMTNVSLSRPGARQRAHARRPARGAGVVVGVGRVQARP